MKPLKHSRTRGDSSEELDWKKQNKWRGTSWWCCLACANFRQQSRSNSKRRCCLICYTLHEPLNSHRFASLLLLVTRRWVIPQTGLPVGFYLRKKIDWTRWWARWAWLGADLALLGALGWVGRGVGCGVWPCWVRWLGWAWCWLWGLAVLGALAGLGVVLGVGFGRAGRAGWVGRGVWPCWVRWLGWAWCWLWGLAVLGALAGLGVVLGVGFGRAGRASWVGRGVGRVWPCWARWLGWAWFQSTKVLYSGSTKVHFQITQSILSKYTNILSKYKSILWKYKRILSKYQSILWKYKSTLSNYTKYTFKVHKFTFKVQKYTLEVQRYTLQVQKYTFKVQEYFQITQVYFQSTKIYSGSTKVYSGSTKVYCGGKTQKQGCWECYLIKLIYLHCLGSMLVSFYVPLKRLSTNYTHKDPSLLWVMKEHSQRIQTKQSNVWSARGHRWKTLHQGELTRSLLELPQSRHWITPTFSSSWTLWSILLPESIMTSGQNEPNIS